MYLSKEHSGAGFLLLIFVIVIVFTSVIVLSLMSNPVEDMLKQDSVIRVLFVIENEGEPLSTNVFIYYAPLKRGVIINIPGNTGSIYKSIDRVDRIDRVYVEKGIASYKEEIERLCGIAIPFYIVIGRDGLSQLADMMGGLKVLVSEPVDSVSSNGDLWLLPSGSVSLDGEKIITYITYAFDDETEADIESRRLMVLFSFLEALNRNAHVMIQKNNFHFYADKMTSNIDKDGMFKLFEQISSVDAESVVSQTVTGSTRTVDGKSLLFPFYDGELVKDVVKQATNLLLSEHGTMVNRIYVLEIKNGTAVTGLAHNTAALLRSAGYDVLTTLNADSNDVERTSIINHIGNEEAAKNLGDFIHCKNIVNENVHTDDSTQDSGDMDVDFTIILGKDFDGRYVH